MYDFFDYLAGEKIILPEHRNKVEETTITFKISAPLPKPSIHKYKKSKKENYRPIELQQVQQ